jgi:hypothetical protein
MQSVGGPDDTPETLREKANEFARQAEEEGDDPDMAAELRRLARQYLDYADFLERNAPRDPLRES